MGRRDERGRGEEKVLQRKGTYGALELPESPMASGKKYKIFRDLGKSGGRVEGA